MNLACLALITYKQIMEQFDADAQVGRVYSQRSSCCQQLAAAACAVLHFGAGCLSVSGAAQLSTLLVYRRSALSQQHRCKHRASSSGGRGCRRYVASPPQRACRRPCSARVAPHRGLAGL